MIILRMQHQMYLSVRSTMCCTYSMTRCFYIRMAAVLTHRPASTTSLPSSSFQFRIWTLQLLTAVLRHVDWKRREEPECYHVIEVDITSNQRSSISYQEFATAGDCTNGSVRASVDSKLDIIRSSLLQRFCAWTDMQVTRFT